MVKSGSKKAKQLYRSLTDNTKNSFNSVASSKINSSDSCSSRSNEISVSALIEQSRRENASFANAQLPAYIEHELGDHAFLPQREQDNNTDAVIRDRVSFGPAPPKSWQYVWHKNRAGKQEFEHKERERKKQVWDGPLNKSGEPSLADICAEIVTLNIISYKSHSYFSKIPTHLKQKILSLATLHHPLDDQLLSLFAQDLEYEELDLANSTISFERLKEAFWKVPKKRNRSNYKGEADEEQISISVIDINILSSSSEVLVIHQSPPLLSTSTTKYICTLQNLRRLNLSFIPNIDSAQVSTLLVTTLPLLTHLSIAGCFNNFTSLSDNGPLALSILSRGLINLLFLDLSFCDWVLGQVLLDRVNWTRDLRSLRVLVAIGCGPWGFDKDVLISKMKAGRRTFVFQTEFPE
ncbi:6580_t:CDS:2 [Ambispora leptoticha]|uniref:6580_t:CDS:1 n=1 Tax=Ambispora leptoticha TaxID=144679 RepID=A0A9N9FMI4_9GLOM|nr:6580_t:CDS:2 [Ambispora leptoticha]